jgi:hypothetical protein
MWHLPRLCSIFNALKAAPSWPSNHWRSKMEFTDVKSKDFIELAGIPEHLQGKVIAEQRVKWRLHEALQANDIHEPIER